MGELVAEKRKFSWAKDQLMPTADSPLVAGQQVYVVRNGVTTTTVTEDIAMPKQYATDATLAYGTSAVPSRITRQKPLPTKLICAMA